MKATHVFLLLSLPIVFLTACKAKIGAPTEQKVTVQGEQIPFEICGESTTWIRPTEEEQKAKWWDNLRYAGAADEVIQYPWTHNFFVAYGHASLDYDLENLSGLWTLASDVRSKCLEPERQDAILKLEKAEVWLLFHRVKDLRRTGSDYYIVVSPAEKGVQFVQFARPVEKVPLTLHIVTEKGQEVEKIIEAESMYWPYPSLIPTPQP